MFQSLIGSLKTKDDEFDYYYITEFQSLIGSLKTRYIPPFIRIVNFCKSAIILFIIMIITFFSSKIKIL